MTSIRRPRPSIRRALSAGPGLRARKAAEQALQSSELRYRRLFEAAQDGILILDGQTGAIVDVNPFLTGRLGFSRKELLGKRLWEIGLFKDQESSKEAFAELASHGYVRYDDLKLRCKDGSALAVEFVSNAYDVAGDRVYQCNIRDISGRRKIEQALKESEQRLRSLVANVSEVIGIIGADGTIIYISPAIRAVGGYEPQEVTGHDLLEVVHPDDRAAARSAISTLAVRPGEMLRFELRLLRKDGTARDMETVARNLLDTPGTNGFVLSSRDVTESNKAQRDLRAAHERLQSATEGAGVGVWEADLRTRKLIWDPGMRQLYALPDTEPDPDIPAWFNHVHPQDQARFRAKVLEVLEGRSDRFDEDFRIRLPDGAVRWLRGHGKVTRNQNGAPLRASGISLDITERKQAEQAIRDALSELHEAQRVAHFGSWRLDSATQQVTWTDEIFEMFGMAPRAAAPTYAEQQRLYTKESFERMAAALRRAEEEDIPYELDLETVRADGSNGWVLARGKAVRDDKGRMVGMRGTALDISRRKHTEQALAQSHARFRALTENSSDLIVVLDAEGIVRYASPSLTRIGGYGPDEIVGRRFSEIMHPDDVGRMLEDLGTMVAQPGDEVHTTESRYKHKDGHWIWLASVAKNALADPAVNGIVLNARDVTERKENESVLLWKNAFLQALAESTLEGILVVDANGHKIFQNQRCVELWKIPPELADATDDTRQVAYVMNATVDPEAFAEGVRDLYTHPQEKSLMEIRLKDGTILDRYSAPVVDADGHCYGRIWSFRDVTESRRADKKIRRLNRVYAVLSSINGLIVRIRDPIELFREASRIAVEAGGFVMAWAGRVDRETKLVRPEGWAGADVRGFLDAIPADRLATVAGNTGLPGRAVYEKRPLISNDVLNDPQRSMRKELAERGVKSLAMLPLLQGGQALGVVALYAAEPGAFDDEELRLLVELAGNVSFALDYMSKADKVAYLAYYDVQTGLPNRALFVERLQQYLRHAAAIGERSALVLIDVQRFHNVNETFGRQVGDMVLKELAGRLAASAGEESSPARIGTDVFAFVAKNIADASGAMEKAKRSLDACFAKPLVVERNELRLVGRTGIAVFPNDAADAEGLLRNAEAALGKAREEGVEALFYSPEMNAHVSEKLNLESQLRRAVDAEEFVLHYQPKVDTVTGAVTSLEALIRWQRPDGELLLPLHFIPLLEETGLILPVGEWALREAARQHAVWRSAGLPAPRIAVNVSALQLRSKDFVARLRAALGPTPVAECGLDLEITESVIMRDVQDNIEKLSAAKRLGMRIVVDDFGTGYSSLRYISKLPLDALKVDHSFIVDMTSSPEDMSIVTSIIALGRDLGLLTIAEGIETEEQARLMRLLKCDEMQGFLFSKALPASEVQAFLNKSMASKWTGSGPAST
ncbi:PAS domain S-box protein [Nevskia soli]|uniref:PAS domain S-box protein n=1 Tax=Nevskia soli TaxID=418856 RepID=UPI00068E6DE4|nr:PAS domain S-box protein [Nevskia soli]